jgi:hypothetical protein
MLAPDKEQHVVRQPVLSPPAELVGRENTFCPSFFRRPPAKFRLWAHKGFQFVAIERIAVHPSLNRRKADRRVTIAAFRFTHGPPPRGRISKVPSFGHVKNDLENSLSHCPARGSDRIRKEFRILA